MLDAPYASASAIAVDALKLFLPPERLTVPAYAVRNRKLDNAGGGHVGLWTNEKAPYTVQPSECLDGLDFLTVAVVGPGQVAKTVIGENWFLKSVGSDPADMLWYMQSEDGLESYVKSRINPMIDLHDEILRDRIGKRAVDDSLHFKNFGSMRVEFLTATLKTLVNKSAPRIIADEIDNWQFLGDPKTLLDIRRQTFGRQSMLLALSHPDRAKGLKPETDWTAGIMAIYADSDRRVWYWPCPHCGAHSSPAPLAQRVMTLVYPEDAPLDVVERETHLLCPVNGCLIGDHEREAMNLAAFHTAHGGWVGQGQEISEGGLVTGELVQRDTAGFWIVGAMSPFVLGGIGALARARVKAERERDASGEDASLRQVIVKQWGVPYSPRRGVGSVEASELVDRAEDSLIVGKIPAGVRFFTVSADVQAGRFEYLKRGFGVNGESWVLEYDRIVADPATRPEDWDRLLEVALAPMPLADGSGRTMAPRAFGFDTHGQPGVTSLAYAAWLRWRKAGIAKLFGQISGREAWSIIPLRGANTKLAPRLQITYPDTARKAGKVSAGSVPVGHFNPNTFKDDLAGQLQRGDVGDWYVHVPAGLKSKDPPHLFFEQLVAEHRKPDGRWEKIVASARNEVLDLMVMSHVVAHLHGLPRLDWASPPAWAAEHDANSLVSKPPAPGGPPEDGGERRSSIARIASRLA
jgi:phage terminase large subunit GpA-like protein